MQVTRKSILSGVVRTMELDISMEQIAVYESGAYIQDAFPQLGPAEREFYVTGITDEEWYTIFTEEERFDETE